MARIIVSVINDLETDQRVHKVCTTLHDAGYDVLLVGRITSESGVLKRNYETHRMRLFFSKGPFFYAEYNLRLFFKLWFSKSDILLSNDLDTLLANFLVSRIRGKPLVYDTHEYFTEVPELKGRFAKRIWEYLEQLILPKLKHVITVNQSLADIYSAKYGIKANVIRNLPKSVDQENSENREYMIYQGAINEGRGLEQLVSAMLRVEFPLIIVGDGDIKADISELIRQNELEGKVRLLDRLAPDELLELTKRAKIGFNLLIGDSLNYKYSLANKFFDYIQSEIPVITMKYPEYERIFEQFDVGILLDDLNEESIVAAINELLKSDVFDQKTQGIRAAKKEFIWEKEEPKLKRIFAQF